MLITSIEETHSWESNIFSATNKIYHFSWNPKIHDRFHKNPPLVPVLCYISSEQTLSPPPRIYLRFILLLFYHLYGSVQIFIPVFATKSLYAIFIYPKRSTFFAHPIVAQAV